MKTTRQLYGQFLLSTQTNYTCTYLADHIDQLDEHSIYRYLRNAKLSPSLVWQKAQEQINFVDHGYMIFDDTVLSKVPAHKIEPVGRQWRGNAKSVIKGLGLVTCVYYNPEADDYSILDYRFFDPDRDGKSKPDHVADMLASLKARAVLFKTVLMDTWYASKKIMLLIDKPYDKIYDYPLRKDRKVDDSGGEKDYCHVSKLVWSEEEEKCGKLIKIYKFPKDYNQHLFRVSLSTERTAWIVTNALTQKDSEEARKERAVGRKIEQLHREAKQLTGIEACQCRKNRSQRNHICCALLVWHSLKRQAKIWNTSIYQVKERMLRNYMIEQMKKPAIIF